MGSTAHRLYLLYDTESGGFTNSGSSWHWASLVAVAIIRGAWKRLIAVLKIGAIIYC